MSLHTLFVAHTLRWAVHDIDGYYLYSLGQFSKSSFNKKIKEGGINNGKEITNDD